MHSQDEDIFKHIKRPSKVEVEEQFKKHKIDVISKLRQSNHTASKTSRYKVINCFRTNNLHLSTAEDEKGNAGCTVFDIELNEDNVKDVESKTSSEPSYVYDLYYTNSDELGDAELNEFVR